MAGMEDEQAQTKAILPFLQVSISGSDSSACCWKSYVHILVYNRC